MMTNNLPLVDYKKSVSITNKQYIRMLYILSLIKKHEISNYENYIDNGGKKDEHIYYLANELEKSF